VLSIIISGVASTKSLVSTSLVGVFLESVELSGLLENNESKKPFSVTPSPVPSPPPPY
jgi:hypothetical protein